MRHSYNMNERIWRVIVFALALLLITVINFWHETASEEKWRAQVEEQIGVVRTLVTETQLDLDSRHLYAELMRSFEISFEIADIPLLLDAIEREDEQVGYVLSQIVTTTGRLHVPANSWKTTAEWKQIWNERVQQAEVRSEKILSDLQLSEEERAQMLIELGAPVIPHLISYMTSEYIVRDGAVTALRSMLGESVVPEWRNAGERRVWTMRNRDKYSGLGYKFE